MSPVCGHCAKLCSNGDGVTLICLSPLQHTAHTMCTRLYFPIGVYTPLSLSLTPLFTVPPGSPREKSSIDRPRDRYPSLRFRFHPPSKHSSRIEISAEKSPTCVSSRSFKRVEPQHTGSSKGEGKGLAFSRLPGGHHCCPFPLPFPATISNLRVFRVARFLEVVVQWTMSCSKVGR